MRKSSIEIAIENKTTEALIQDWAETDYRMSNGKNEFKGAWTMEQHIEFCRGEVSKVESEMSKPKVEAKKTFDTSKSNKWYNTGCGYYGTARDAKRGFDGIE